MSAGSEAGREMEEEVRPDANGLWAGALENGEMARDLMLKNGPVVDATRAHQCGCDHYYG